MAASERPTVTRLRGSSGAIAGSLGPHSPLAEQIEHLTLVHHSRPAGCSQVGQTPPVTLTGGGDHVAGAVYRPPF